MNSGELLDDLDVVFATVVTQIRVRKNSFSFVCKTNDLPSGIWCFSGFVDPLRSPCLPRSGPTHWVRGSVLGNVLFSSGVSGHRQWKT